MKKSFTIHFLLCFAILLSSLSTSFAMPTSDDPSFVKMPISNGCVTADAQMPLLGSGKLLDTAGAAFLYEMKSGTVMYAWNPDVPMEPASLVKIMTGLLAVEKGTLTDIVTVRAEALNSLPENASTTDLQLGEQISLSDLLYCLLVGSSNDAAVVIADYIGGSQEAFVSQMNDKGQSLGLRSTVFTNSHGLHDEQQCTTARDMAKLVAYACQIEAFKPFFALTEYVVPATNLSEERELSSTNYMMVKDKPLYYDSRVTGGRTGITSNRDRCLAVTAESDTLSYVGVILSAVPEFKEDGSVKRFGSYEEMGQLLDMAFDGYKITQIFCEEQVLMQCNVTGGANCVAAMPESAVTAVLPSNISIDKLSVQYQQNIHELVGPVEEGAVLTEVLIWYNNICIGQSRILAGNSSLAKGTMVIPHAAQGGAHTGTVLLIVLIVLVSLTALFFGVLFAVRYFKKVSFKATQRRRRRERRRSR